MERDGGGGEAAAAACMAAASLALLFAAAFLAAALAGAAKVPWASMSFRYETVQFLTVRLHEEAEKQRTEVRQV